MDKIKKIKDKTDEELIYDLKMTMLLREDNRRAEEEGEGIPYPFAEKHLEVLINELKRRNLL